VLRFACVVATLAALVLAAPAQADARVDLERLQVEKKAEPIGIDVDRPRFSWVIRSRAKGVE
jgi:alpha-L-rhamnosidase